MLVQKLGYLDKLKVVIEEECWRLMIMRCMVANGLLSGRLVCPVGQ